MPAAFAILAAALLFAALAPVIGITVALPPAPAAAPTATRAARSELRQLLDVQLRQSPLTSSELAQFAHNLEELFWLGATHTVFMSHRGRIDGMSFDDLLDEAVRPL